MRIARGGRVMVHGCPAVAVFGSESASAARGDDTTYDLPSLIAVCRGSTKADRQRKLIATGDLRLTVTDAIRNRPRGEPTAVPRHLACDAVIADRGVLGCGHWC